MANVSNVTARVYARALLEIGKERGKVAEFLEDIQTVLQLIKADKELRVFYESPKVSRQDKAVLIDKVFHDRIAPELVSLLHVLARKNRAPLLDNIVGQMLDLYDRDENRLHADIEVAAPLAQEVKESLRARLVKLTGKDVVVRERVNAGVVGGMVVRLGDQLLDGSIRARMRTMRQQMASR